MKQDSLYFLIVQVGLCLTLANRMDLKTASKPIWAYLESGRFGMPAAIEHLSQFQRNGVLALLMRSAGDANLALFFHGQDCQVLQL
jgi:hypothetical protein